MKREILFRGKSIEDNNWVYGYYGIKGIDTDIEKRCIMQSNLNTWSSIDFFYFTDIEIHSETIGQFTGLLDKNGNNIFEGDLLKADNFDKIMLVIWRKDLASFALAADGWMYDHYFGEAADPNYCEIIGNIHDNSELIKLD